MPGMVEWTTPAAVETSEAEPTTPTPPVKQAPAKVSVDFNAGRLKWAELDVRAPNDQARQESRARQPGHQIARAGRRRAERPL